MFEFFASLFGYILAFLYDLINNYGLAIILFTIIIKIPLANADIPKCDIAFSICFIFVNISIIPTTTIPITKPFIAISI